MRIRRTKEIISIRPRSNPEERIHLMWNRLFTVYDREKNGSVNQVWLIEQTKNKRMDRQLKEAGKKWVGLVFDRVEKMLGLYALIYDRRFEVDFFVGVFKNSPIEWNEPELYCRLYGEQTQDEYSHDEVYEQLYNELHELLFEVDLWNAKLIAVIEEEETK